MVTWGEFLGALRHALNHLYDPRVQRASVLVEILDLGEVPNVGLALQQALVEQIQSLKGDPSASTRAPLQRTYEILLFRYVQQWSQQEVADQLGISVRHLRREQGMALEVLAQRLVDRFHVVLEPGSRDEPDAIEQESEEASFAGELAWLRDMEPAGPVSLEQTLPSIIKLVRPMAEEHRVALELRPPQSPLPLALHPVALRQILLSLLSIAIRHAQGSAVLISSAAGAGQVTLRVQASAGSLGPLAMDEKASLGILLHLLQVCRGRLDLAPESLPFSAALSLPIQEQAPVLVIDDNADTLALIQRYLGGTRFRFLGARTLAEALTVARDDPPRAIVLDVMMPEMDGWELMGRLREHPVTLGIPIIVCTILAEEDLALSLGAGAFLRKPVSREALLQALESQVYGQRPESR